MDARETFISFFTRRVVPLADAPPPAGTEQAPGDALLWAREAVPGTRELRELEQLYADVVNAGLSAWQR